VRRSEGAWLRTISQTVAWRYTIALVAFLVSFFVRALLNNWLIGISDRGLVVFLPAIILVSFFLGLGPAILTALLSFLATWYFFIPPYYSFELGIDGAIVLATFAVGSAVSIALVHWLRTTIRAASKYSSMLDGGFDAIILRDTQDRIRVWNRGAEGLYGWTRDEVVGRDIHALLQTKFPKSPGEILVEMRRDGRWEGELIHTRRDGSRIVVSSRWTPEWDAKKERLVSVLQTNTDVTERKQVEARVAADLLDMTRLVQLSNRLVRQGSDHAGNLNAVVDTAIAITGADKGNLQLLASTTGELTIAAQRGFEAPFLNFFASVRDDASACAAAMRSGEQVVVEDVRDSKIFAGQPSREVMLDAGAYAVISTPLMASTGNPLGMISTHFAMPHHPSERELRLTDLLARQTADYLERKQADETEQTLAREIQHRSNNLLSVVQTIATRSLSGSYTLAEAKEAFEARLQALARSNRQLTKSNWSGVSLSEIARSELRPYAERTIVDGIDVILSPQHAQNFTLTLHELATNAAKYGALSNGSGKVGVSWKITRLNGNNKLGFKWQESGGPPVVVPTRQGFGTTLVKTTFPDARIDYAVEGLSCEIDIPVGQDEAPVTENQWKGDYAEECLKIARSATDERTRAVFSQMAKVWFGLAEEKTKSGSE
jgi:PAS domain S-box-containing protein